MPQFKKRKGIFGNEYYVEDFDNSNWMQDAADWLWNTLGGDRLDTDGVVSKVRSSTDFGDTSAYFDNMSDAELLNLIMDEYGGDAESFRRDVENLQGIQDAPELPTYEKVTEDIFNGNDPIVNNYLAELQADEDRQTALFQQQLADSNRIFNDYRQNVLSNQYQQNSQLMQTVGSEMSRARRNAIEAGASAGLRIAENVNTILSTQNKQSQLSLETSNQLAQQLLNQRQATAGIRSGYNDMLSQNSAERRGYKNQAVENRYNRETTDYNSRVDNWNSQFDPSSNALAGGYQAYLQTKNAKNKSQSQYN